MDVFNRVENADQNIEANLGPLKTLVGLWEGDKGLDISIKKNGRVETPFREQIRFTATGPIVNGPQVLYGLNYSTIAYKLENNEAFHDELGYWLWDGEHEEVMRCFTVPRGIAVNAGGKSKAEAKEFEMSAKVGEDVYGISSNSFLDKAFKTVRYDLKVTIKDDEHFDYFEDTQLKIHGMDKLFHHTDQNSLRKVESFQ